MTRYLLACLLFVPPVLAQDDCGPCDTACDSKDCATELATARKELSTWKSDMKGLSRVERNALKGAEKTVHSNCAKTKALAPTFGAAADTLAVLAAMETAVAGERTDTAKVAAELAKTYRAMAQAIAGKDSYPAPKLSTTDELKAAVKKADAEAKKARDLWAKAGEQETSSEVKDAMKLLRQASPRMRALAVNANAAAKAMKAVKCEAKSAEADMRPALVKTAQSLHAAAAPYFKNVKLEKPEPMAPAPST